MEANTTGSQGSRRAVVPSLDDDDDDIIISSLPCTDLTAGPSGRAV